MLGHLVYNGHGETHFGWPIQTGWIRRLMRAIAAVVRG